MSFLMLFKALSGIVSHLLWYVSQKSKIDNDLIGQKFDIAHVFLSPKLTLPYSVSDKDLTIGVNNFSQSEHYTSIKPKLYLIQDDYFSLLTVEEHYNLLRSNTIFNMIARTNWEMKVHIYYDGNYSYVASRLAGHKFIKLFLFKKPKFPLIMCMVLKIFSLEGFLVKRKRLLPLLNVGATALQYAAACCKTVFVYGLKMNYVTSLCNRNGILGYTVQDRFLPASKSKQGYVSTTLSLELFRWAMVAAMCEYMLKRDGRALIKIMDVDSLLKEPDRVL